MSLGPPVERALERARRVHLRAAVMLAKVRRVCRPHIRYDKKLLGTFCGSQTARKRNLGLEMLRGPPQSFPSPPGQAVVRG